METLWEVISGVLLVAGSLFAVIGGLGIVRLPDFYTRLHGSGMTDTLGAGLILVGLMFQSGVSFATAKLVMILVFSLLAGTTASHAMAKAANKSGLKLNVEGHNEEQSEESASKP